jgi:hypothetical protein
MHDSFKLCTRCHKPVIRHYDDYELFEGMHWLCFHLEFEHVGDPDELWRDPGCPWWHIEVYKEALSKLNLDHSKILEAAIAAMADRDISKRNS